MPCFGGSDVSPPFLRSLGFATPEGEVTCAFGNGDKLYDDVTFLGYADPAPPAMAAPMSTP